MTHINVSMSLIVEIGKVVAIYLAVQVHAIMRQLFVVNYHLCLSAIASTGIVSWADCGR